MFDVSPPTLGPSNMPVVAHSLDLRKPKTRRVSMTKEWDGADSRAGKESSTTARAKEDEGDIHKAGERHGRQVACTRCGRKRDKDIFPIDKYVFTCASARGFPIGDEGQKAARPGSCYPGPSSDRGKKRRGRRPYCFPRR